MPLADGTVTQITRASASQRPLFVLDALEQQLVPEPGKLGLASQQLQTELLSRWLLVVHCVLCSVQASVKLQRMSR